MGEYERWKRLSHATSRSTSDRERLCAACSNSRGSAWYRDTANANPDAHKPATSRVLPGGQPKLVSLHRRYSRLTKADMELPVQTLSTMKMWDHKVSAAAFLKYLKDLLSKSDQALLSVQTRDARKHHTTQKTGKTRYEGTQLMVQRHPKPQCNELRSSKAYLAPAHHQQQESYGHITNVPLSWTWPGSLGSSSDASVPAVPSIWHSDSQLADY